MYQNVITERRKLTYCLVLFLDVTGGKAPMTQIKKLANKARQFNKCVKKAEGHLKRLGDENDRER